MRQFSFAPQRATIRTKENSVNWRKKFVRQYVAPIAPGALDKNDPEMLMVVVVFLPRGDDPHLIAPVVGLATMVPQQTQHTSWDDSTTTTTKTTTMVIVTFVDNHMKKGNMVW
jgi:hypothetical protein